MLYNCFFPLSNTSTQNVRCSGHFRSLADTYSTLALAFSLSLLFSSSFVFCLALIFHVRYHPLVSHLSSPTSTVMNRRMNSHRQHCYTDPDSNVMLCYVHVLMIVCGASSPSRTRELPLSQSCSTGTVLNAIMHKVIMHNRPPVLEPKVNYCVSGPSF